MKQKKIKKEQQENRNKHSNTPSQSHQIISAEERNTKSNHSYNFLLILTVIITGVIIYSNSFDCSFHFDDVNIFTNSVQNTSSTITDWLRLFPSRPVGTLTFALNYYIHGLNVWGYHFVNLLIHLTNAFLVWWLTWLTLSAPFMKNEEITRHKVIISFLTSLLFVSHPLATQSVTYIVQRFASLATLFYLLSLALFIKGRLWQGRKNIQRLLLACSIFSGILGMLTKEIVFTLPFAILLYDYCFIRKGTWRPEIKDPALITSVIMLAIFILIFLNNFSPLKVFDTIPPIQGYTYSISMKEYLLTQFNVIITYIRLFFLPINQNLDYDYPVAASLFELKTFLNFSLLLGILAIGVISLKKYRLISFGIFWFFLTIAVESSIIPISQNVIFEHRTYLSGFGFFLAFVSFFFYFFKERFIQTAVIIILLIALINAVLTWERNKIWKSDYTLWSDCIRKAPNKARTHNNFGIALAVEGKIDQAIVQFRNTLKIIPNDDEAHYNLAKAFKQQGNIEEAILYYRETVRINPRHFNAYYNLGLILQDQQKYDEALYHFRQAQQINPNEPKIYLCLGVIMAEKGKLTEAIEFFRQAIYLNPDYEKARQNLKIVLSLQQERKK
ncbi:MAG: tetratricopeptide repeat protein [Smithellaceae bacterium]